MSKLKRRVCKIIKEAGLGIFEPENILMNSHLSYSEEKFWVGACLNSSMQGRFYWSGYTLTQFVSEYRKHGNPAVQDLSELVFNTRKNALRPTD